MAAILTGNIFKRIFLNENSNSNFTETCPRSAIDSKSELVQVMARRRTGDEPLPEQLLRQFTDEYMLHQGKMS